ncbi:hypothetical protein [uncultured Sphingomonas sp.]|uniref:hypothetical protein n=1 Tax=uncultured Sphingomonas sp. TaxID=158754 RepID=UPI0025FE2A76|nr:hypothetical protein [uncultured Sphingomonas sp.]
MDAAFENALRTIAASYEVEVSRHGGKSLARVATIVVNNGAFFTRLREGKTFTVANLERFAAWFRQSANWPLETIPHDAAYALASMGRAPDNQSIPHTCGTARHAVASNRQLDSYSSDA